MMRIPDKMLFQETAESDVSPQDAFLRRKRSHLNHSALVAAQNVYTAAMDAWLESAIKERRGAAAAGVAKECMEQHTRIVDEVLVECPVGENAQSAFAVWAKGRAHAACLRMAAFEDSQRQEYAFEQHEIRRGGIFRSVTREPEQFAEFTVQLEEIHVLSVGQGLFSPREAQNRLNQDKITLQDMAFDGLYAKNPDKALGVMDALGFDDARKERERHRSQGDARARELLEDAARRDTLRVLADLAAEAVKDASLTGQGGALRGIAARYLNAGDSAASAEHLRLADFYESQVVVIKESMAMDLPALAEKIRQLEKAQCAVERMVRSGVYQHREAAFAEDPVEATAGEALGENGEEMVAYRLAAQERNGIPDCARRVLTRKETRLLVEIAGSLAQADTVERCGAVRDFQHWFGRYAARALAEVASAMGGSSGVAFMEKGEGLTETVLQGD